MCSRHDFDKVLFQDAFCIGDASMVLPGCGPALCARLFFASADDPMFPRSARHVWRSCGECCCFFGPAVAHQEFAGSKAQIPKLRSTDQTHGPPHSPDHTFDGTLGATRPEPRSEVQGCRFSSECICKGFDVLCLPRRHQRRVHGHRALHRPRAI